MVWVKELVVKKMRLQVKLNIVPNPPRTLSKLIIDLNLLVVTMRRGNNNQRTYYTCWIGPPLTNILLAL